jgi:hypothetical protein
MDDLYSLLAKQKVVKEREREREREYKTEYP